MCSPVLRTLLLHVRIVAGKCCHIARVWLPTTSFGITRSSSALPHSGSGLKVRYNITADM